MLFTASFSCELRTLWPCLALVLYFSMPLPRISMRTSEKRNISIPIAPSEETFAQFLVYHLWLLGVADNVPQKYDHVAPEAHDVRCW